MGRRARQRDRRGGSLPDVTETRTVRVDEAPALVILAGVVNESLPV